MSHRFRIALLGGFEVAAPSGIPLKLSTRKAQGLLAYLGARAGVECERDVLAGLLWGNRDDDHARNSLRQTLFLLRRLTDREEPQLLNITNHTVALNPSAAEVDVRDFERSIRGPGANALQTAAELYRGDLLDGFTVDEAPFEEWLLQERERLRELAMDALGRLLQLQRSNGRVDEAIRTCRRLLALEPWQEPAHRTLMRLLVQTGQHTAALRHYQQCQEILRRELGVEPELETRQLFEGIRARHQGSDDGGNGSHEVSHSELAASIVGPRSRRGLRTAADHARLVKLQISLSRQIVKLSRQHTQLVRGMLDVERHRRDSLSPGGGRAVIRA